MDGVHRLVHIGYDCPAVVSPSSSTSFDYRLLPQSGLSREYVSLLMQMQSHVVKKAKAKKERENGE